MVDPTCTIHLRDCISELDLAHGHLFPTVVRDGGPNQKAQGMVLRGDILHHNSGPRQDRKGHLNILGFDVHNLNWTNPYAGGRSLRDVQVIKGRFNMERYPDKSLHLDLSFICHALRGAFQCFASDSVQGVLGDEEPNLFRGKHNHRANFH